MTPSPIVVDSIFIQFIFIKRSTPLLWGDTTHSDSHTKLKGESTKMGWENRYSNAILLLFRSNGKQPHKQLIYTVLIYNLLSLRFLILCLKCKERFIFWTVCLFFFKLLLFDFLNSVISFLFQFCIATVRLILYLKDLNKKFWLIIHIWRKCVDSYPFVSIKLSAINLFIYFIMFGSYAVCKGVVV